MHVFEYLLKIKKAYIVIAVWALVTIVISLSITDTVLLIIETRNPPQALSLKEENKGLTVLKSGNLASSLELFGGTTKSNQTINDLNSPETSLNLELQGIFIAEKAKRSSAIIGENKKKGQLFLIGDNIFGKGKIIAINEGYVLISRNGRKERIVFSDHHFRTKKNDSSLLTSDLEENQIRKKESTQKTIVSTFDQKIVKKTARNNLSDQVDIRAKFMNRPSEALSELGVTRMSTGEIGYKIDRDADKRILQAGLQEGDRILSINGQMLDSGMAEKDIARQAMSAGRLRVEVARGERRFFLTVPVPRKDD